MSQVLTTSSITRHVLGSALRTSTTAAAATSIIRCRNIFSPFTLAQRSYHSSGHGYAASQYENLKGDPISPSKDSGCELHPRWQQNPNHFTQKLPANDARDITATDGPREVALGRQSADEQWQRVSRAERDEEIAIVRQVRDLLMADHLKNDKAASQTVDLHPVQTALSELKTQIRGLSDATGDLVSKHNKLPQDLVDLRESVKNNTAKVGLSDSVEGHKGPAAQAADKSTPDTCDEPIALVLMCVVWMLFFMGVTSIFMFDILADMVKKWQCRWMVNRWKKHTTCEDQMKAMLEVLQRDHWFWFDDALEKAVQAHMEQSKK